MKARLHLSSFCHYVKARSSGRITSKESYLFPFCHYVEAPSSGQITSKESYPIPTKEEVQWAPKPVLTLQTADRLFVLKGGFETTTEHYTNWAVEAHIRHLETSTGCILENQPTTECSERRRRRRSSDCAINTNSHSLADAHGVKQVRINNAGHVECKKKIPTKFVKQFHIFVTVVRSRELIARNLSLYEVNVIYGVLPHYH